MQDSRGFPFKAVSTSTHPTHNTFSTSTVPQILSEHPKLKMQLWLGVAALVLLPATTAGGISDKLNAALASKGAKRSGMDEHQYCIVGAGPAGLQLGHLMHTAGRDYTILEKSTGAGSFFERYPRHRKLISLNKRLTGRHDADFNLRHGEWTAKLLAVLVQLRMPL
jgi:hypothetical protein